jgi:hypothetical protein
MKLRSFVRLSAALISTAVAGDAAFGQMPGAGGSSTMMNAAMLKQFENNPEFTSKAEFRSLDKSRHETGDVPMTYALLDGKWRMEIDLNQIKISEAPAGMIPTLNQLGMDQTVVISRPDKKMVLSIFPKIKSYVEAPMTKDEITAMSKTYTTSKSALGKETVDGHVCEKNKVVLTGDKGEKVETTVWNATDMKGFPIQIESPADEGSVVMKFKEVKLGKPDLKQFEVPSGLTKFETVDSLVDERAKAQTAGGKK